MAIKFLRGIYGRDQIKTTRPVGFKFPLGLTVSSALEAANSSTTATIGTFDVFVVAGGGNAGASGGQDYHGGGGGAGGVRLLTANSFTDILENKNPAFITGTTNFIPVIVGSAGANSCFSSNFLTCRGGSGGPYNSAGGVGGSGGGGGRRPQLGAQPGGAGIVGQGCCGTPASATQSGAGGSATCSCTSPAVCNINGLTTSFTGTSLRFGDGGPGHGNPVSAAGIAAVANRGNGGGGPAGAGGSGIVAIRYCNPAAPTTPLVTGGDCICCTGGCIIHIFNSSGFFNVNTSFSIN